MHTDCPVPECDGEVEYWDEGGETGYVLGTCDTCGWDPEEDESGDWLVRSSLEWDRMTGGGE